MSEPTKHTIKFNCGFARCAIRELTVAQSLNMEQRKEKLLELFSACPDYGLKNQKFQSNKGRPSLFDRNCQKIIEAWRTKWNTVSSKTAYEAAFSVDTWSAMSPSDQQRHTLASCYECCTKFPELQQNFPLKPYYNVSVVEIRDGVLQRMGKKESTQNVLKQLNQKFEDTFSKSFTESVIQYGRADLQVAK